MIDRIFCLLLVFSLGFSLPLNAQEEKSDFELKTHKKKEYVVTIHTPEGDMVLLLHDETPKHKANFVKLAEEGYYNGLSFHRVMKGFMIQGGDPYSKEGGKSGKVGTGGPGYTLDAEINASFKHEKGSLAAARQPDFSNPQRRSSGSQFYIVHNPASCQHLNGSYTIFGQVIEGMDVIDKIALKPVNRANRPLEDVRMTVEVAFLKKKKITKLYGYEFED
ncbi:MAG: peptidylprolyl isomerase [Bacteroidota bacterium]